MKRQTIAGAAAALALVAMLATSGGRAQQADRAADFAINNVTTSLYHEFGHLLIDQFEWPVLGREENAADTIMTMLLLDAGEAADAIAADAVRGEIVLPSYLLQEYTRAAPGRVHVVRVRGDSMESTLSSGDRVLVDTTDSAIGQGGVFVILDPDGEVMVKRLRKLPKGSIEVVSDNPKQPSDVYPADQLRVIGRAVARLSRI